MMTTFVSMLLDETGSMEPIKDDTIGGVNQYVDTLEDSKDKIRFTLVKFDSTHETAVCEAVDPSEAPRLDNSNYQPGAMTPLIDAIFNLVKRTEKLVAAKKNPEKHNVAVVIQTDGKENRSRENTKEQLKELITGKEKEGWVFTFIGAGIDAFAEAEQYGFKAGSTMSYSRDKSGESFVAVASNTRAYAETGVAASLDFTQQQRDDSGEDKVVDKTDESITAEDLSDASMRKLAKLAKQTDKRRKASIVSGT